MRTEADEAGTSVHADDADARVLVELWTSFVSLVRSYLAGAQAYLPAATPRAEVTVNGRGETVIVTPSRYLLLDPGAGTAASLGYWALYDGAPDPDRMIGDGSFRLGLDSRVEWTGIPGRVELEQVAEALTTMMLDTPEEA